MALCSHQEGTWPVRPISGLEQGCGSRHRDLLLLQAALCTIGISRESCKFPNSLSGPPRARESWRARTSDRGGITPSLTRAFWSGEEQSALGSTAKDATFLRDVRGTRRQVPVNQRPAGSREE